MPAITQWQDPYDKVDLSNMGQILTEESKAICTIAAAPCVSFTFHGQVATGEPLESSEEQEEVLCYLDPLASEVVLEEVDGTLPVQTIE